MRCFCLLLLVALALSTTTDALATDPETPATADHSSVGKQIESFELPDFRGKTHALADLAEAKAVVVVFLGAECPLSKLYGPRLAELAREFEPQGARFLGINANRQDSLTELAHYGRLHGIEFPLLKDVGNVVADQFGATRNPEAFVLDADRKIRYQGRIDDQYGFQTGMTGYAKSAVNHHDLAEALREILAGQPVSQPTAKAVGCLIGRIRQPHADSEVTYSKQIARLFQKRCVECHRAGQIAPFALTSYEHAVGWADMIGEVVQQRRMPPWLADPKVGHWANESSLTDEERKLVAAWVTAGAPEGDPRDLPEPREFHGSWMMPYEPDAVFYIDEKPFDVPAEGTVEYKYFRVKTNFTEDKWIKVAECRPDNRAVVHHMIVFIRPPNDIINFATMGYLTGMAPGTRPFVLPEGMAKFVPAGSDLIVQMHYTPNGSPQKDRSAVAVKFEDPKNVRQKVVTANILEYDFVIPAGADDFRMVSERPMRRDVLLISLFPHMHLRGKSFRFDAIYPDGSQEELLYVPHYDFNWQNNFILAEPKRLPAGTKLHCTAHFDNSDANAANPDPTQAVRWGEQTWEEMMVGWFDIAVPRDMEPGDALSPWDAKLPPLHLPAPRPKTDSAARPTAAGSSPGGK